MRRKGSWNYLHEQRIVNTICKTPWRSKEWHGRRIGISPKVIENWLIYRAAEYQVCENDNGGLAITWALELRRLCEQVE
jgi:hypothetical protein